MANENEKKTVTGLDQAEDRKVAEYDLVASLLEAAGYEEDITDVEIKRNGKYLFTVRLHPISEQDARKARKASTVYMKNPNGAKLPPIEKEVDNPKFNSWLIYLATVEEDQQKIWGNRAIMEKYDLQQPWESIDKLLSLGEKQELTDTVLKISGMNDDDDNEENMSEIEFAKN